MSMGGDFYALSDAQLQQVLTGELDFFDFYENDARQGGPAAVFSEGEDAWDWLRLRFEALDVAILGEHHSDMVPELAFYSTAAEVRMIAETLSALEEDQWQSLADLSDLADRDFYHQEYWLKDTEPAEVLELLMGLRDFYQQCARQGWALLYRIT